MNDNSMLTLADKLSDLKDQKSDLMAQLKDLNRQIDEASSSLVQMMVDQECTSFHRGSHMFVLAVKEYLSAIPEEKERLYAVMKENGFRTTMPVSIPCGREIITIVISSLPIER